MVSFLRNYTQGSMQFNSSRGERDAWHRKGRVENPFHTAAVSEQVWSLSKQGESVRLFIVRRKQGHGRIKASGKGRRDVGRTLRDRLLRTNGGLLPLPVDNGQINTEEAHKRVCPILNPGSDALRSPGHSPRDRGIFEIALVHERSQVDRGNLIQHINQFVLGGYSNGY